MSSLGTYYYLGWIAFSYCIILATVMLFYLFIFCKRRNTPIFRKRFFGFVLSINLCGICFVGYLGPIAILTELTKTTTFDNTTITFDLTIGFPYIICQHLFTLLILCRFWLLHFEIKWRFHSRMLSILTQINPTAKELSWYVRHRVTFGNHYVCMRITVALCLVSISISSIVYWICFDHGLRYIWCLTDSLLMALPIIGTFIIWYNTPRFFDHYLIRKELSIIIISGGIGLIGYIMAVISLLYASQGATQFIMIAMVVFGATIYCAISLTSTFWVLQYRIVTSHKASTSVTSSVTNSVPEHSPRTPDSPFEVKKVPKQSGVFIPKTFLKQMTSQRLYRDGTERPENDLMSVRDHGPNVRELTLYNVLENSFGFYAFLCHAAKEYSVENVLAVIEFQQFQDYYKGKERDQRYSVHNDDHKKKDDEADIIDLKISVDIGDEKCKTKHTRMMSSMNDLLEVQMQYHSFYLPPNLPDSVIVHHETLSMRQKIDALCNKYIVSGGEFELNLGSSHRNHLLRKRGNLQAFTDDECAACFNDTIYAVVALMHDSYIRFQLTNSYEQLRKELLHYSDKKRRFTLL